MRVVAKGCFSWILAVSVVLASSAAAAERSDAETQKIMAEIVDALRVLLPLSLDDGRFQDPSNRATVDNALEKLARNARQLESHGSSQEVGFAYLSGSLARDSVDIRTRFSGGRVAEAQFLLQHLTDTCVACHSRLPDDRAHPLGKRLTEDATIAALPREERVQFEVATRQFDRALETYESLFSDPATSLAEVDLTGDLESYLELCLRVQGDPDRAISQLRALAAREDLPARLREPIKVWIDSLQSLGNDPEGSAIVRARGLIDPVIDETRVYDPSQLVRLIAASGLLQRYVASTTDPATQVGEAYYLLGVVESRIGRSFWASQTEFFLEAAIRMGPTQAYAEKAFDLLEEFLVSGYTGSSGTHVPADVTQRLDELSQLMLSAKRDGRN
jgi:hypothetical protein